jgi:hypothetical protein
LGAKDRFGLDGRNQTGANAMRTAKAKASETMTDLGLLGSVIIVGSWVAKRFYGIEIPAEIQLHAGILIMVFGGSSARVLRHKWRYGK